MVLLGTLVLAALVYLLVNGRKFRREGQAAVRYPILYLGPPGDGAARSARANFERMELVAKSSGTGGSSRTVLRLRRRDGPKWECAESDVGSWEDVESALIAVLPEAPREFASKLEVAYQAFLRYNDPAVTFPEADRLFES